MTIETEQEASASGTSVTDRILVVDPSDAVAGLSIVFGASGALVGVLAAVVVLGDFSLPLLGYSALAALAGGSAGIVIGGMAGAILSVAKGIIPPRGVSKQQGSQPTSSRPSAKV